MLFRSLSFNGTVRSHMLGPEVKKQFLKQLVEQRKLVVLAKQAAIDRDPAFRAESWNRIHSFLYEVARARYAETFVPENGVLENYFLGHKTELAADPESKLAILVLNDVQTIEKLSVALKANPLEFASLVKRYSVDKETASRGGSIGWVGLSALSNLVGTKVGSLILTAGVGNVVGPYQTPYGIILVKVISRRTGPPLVFNAVKAIVLEVYRKNERKAILAAWDHELAAKYPARIYAKRWPRRA